MDPMAHPDVRRSHTRAYRQMERLLSGRMAKWPLALVREHVEEEGRYQRSLRFISSADIDLADDSVVVDGGNFLDGITPVPVEELRSWVGRRVWVTMILERARIAALQVQVTEIGERPLEVGVPGPEYTAVAVRTVEGGRPMVMWADRVVAIGEAPPAEGWDPLVSSGANPWANPASDEVWDQLGP